MYKCHRKYVTQYRLSSVRVCVNIMYYTLYVCTNVAIQKVVILYKTLV